MEEADERTGDPEDRGEDLVSKLKANGVDILSICANTDYQAKCERVLKHLKAYCEKHGVTLEDCLEPPKYCHPNNPDLRWNGKGRRPNWLNQLDN